MQNGGSGSGAQTAMMSLPGAVWLSLFRKDLIGRLSRFEGYDFASVSSASQRFSKLTNVGANVDDRVDFSIVDEIDEISNPSSPDVDYSKALVCCPYDPIQ